MDVFQQFETVGSQLLKCVDMHTTGEPTRIVYAGWPHMSGTLLQQRALAKQKHDHLRKQLMLEPRGHFDMYGAILRPETELVSGGEAHIGVLFTTNEGYSTMCGHATIALGRFLLDTHDKTVFPGRDEIEYDASTGTALLKLHAPCGLILVTVPVSHDGRQSDPSRSVSFICVPSFATGIQVKIDLPSKRRWPELQSEDSVVCHFAYGGAFYCLVEAEHLGFTKGLAILDFDALNFATKRLKAAINENFAYRHLFDHPDHDDLGFLYSIMVVDKSIGLALDKSKGAETGLCFFADQQIDRSPTGSAVAARVALAHAYGQLGLNESWTYHSLLSNSWNGKGGFVGTLVGNSGQTKDGFPVANVRVEGVASYTGFSTYVVEPDDPVSQYGGGFVFEKL